MVHNCLAAAPRSTGNKDKMRKIVKLYTVAATVASIWLALSTVSGLLGTSVMAKDAEPLKIGIAGPHTGNYAAFGEQLWKGAQQAAKDINAAGGVDGRKIELVKADDACEPKQAVAVANKLVDRDEVDAVVGHFCSSSTMPASEIYDEAGILNITPASTNPLVTERKLVTTLRTCGRDDQQGEVAAEFIVKNLKAKKVAVVHDKDTYGQGLADAMIKAMNKMGVKEVLYEGLTRGEKDFNALVTKIKSVKADVVYFGGLHTEAGPLVRQIREQGLTAKFMSGDGIVSNDFVTTAGGTQFIEGVYMTFNSDPRNIASSKKVIDAFRAAQYEPEGYTLYSYATVQAVAQAVKAVPKGDGVKRSEWLKKNGAQTIMGPRNWDKNGDLTSRNYVIYQWNKKGEYAEIGSSKKKM